MQKVWISAEQLLRDAVTLGMRVIESGFRPDVLVGIWRGGTPVAIAVQEVFEFAGLPCDHIAVRTTSYTGIAQRGDVAVHGLEYLRDTLQPGASVLLVDDVFDTGRSMEQLLRELSLMFDASLQLRVAVPWFKPTHNLTSLRPDYFLHTTADWLVFPHELVGLDEDELRSKPAVAELADQLLALREQLLQRA